MITALPGQMGKMLTMEMFAFKFLEDLSYSRDFILNHRPKISAQHRLAKISRKFRKCIFVFAAPHSAALVLRQILLDFNLQ